jgi:hypothetical protein
MLALVLVIVPASSNAGVLISIGVEPPALPVYEQPPCPEPGLMWTPGYWAYDQEEQGGYYWVPGAWVPAPYEGALWTPGYWGWERGRYYFHEGYWGRHVGYYGGVNYGFGYGGIGFSGGEWRGRDFHYNTYVMHVDRRYIHHTFEDHQRVERGWVDRNSRAGYYGGPHGIHHDPGSEERFAEHEDHRGMSDIQRHHMDASRGDRGSFASRNGGRPEHGGVDRPFGTGSHWEGERHGEHNQNNLPPGARGWNNEQSGTHRGFNEQPGIRDGNNLRPGVNNNSRDARGADFNNNHGNDSNHGSGLNNNHTGINDNGARNFRDANGSNSRGQSDLRDSSRIGGSVTGHNSATGSSTNGTRNPCITGYDANGVCRSGSNTNTGSRPGGDLSGSCPAGFVHLANGQCGKASTNNNSSSNSGFAHGSLGQGNGHSNNSSRVGNGSQTINSHVNNGSQGSQSLSHNLSGSGAQGSSGSHSLSNSHTGSSNSVNNNVNNNGINNNVHRHQ